MAAAPFTPPRPQAGRPGTNRTSANGELDFEVLKTSIHTKLVEKLDLARLGDLEGDTPGQLFRADLDEVVLTKLTDAGDRLLIQVWRPGAPLRRIERD